MKLPVGILLLLFILNWQAAGQNKIRYKDLKRYGWTLTENLDTAQALASDTLRFVNDWGKNGNQVQMLPDILFERFRGENEFNFAFNYYKIKEGWGSNIELRGTWMLNKKYKTLSITYYHSGPDSGDDLREWIKGIQINYSIIALNNQSLILVKSK